MWKIDNGGLYSTKKLELESINNHKLSRFLPGSEGSVVRFPV